MKSINFFVAVIIGLLLCLGLTGSAQAATYYVRTDGGTSAQCTGTTDAAYPGSGTAKACAFNHPFWALSVSGAPNKMVGGDTLIIGPGQYMMGLGAPNTPVCSSGYPWDCRLRAVPSGTATNPTRILGKGWDKGCPTKPQLWGTERALSVVDLRGSNNVEIQCLDITDHSSCMEFGPDKATRCNRDVYPYGSWALLGIVASDSKNVLLKNVKIHGLRSGILGGRLTDWTLENTDIIANSFVGWDGDIGATVSSNSGTTTFKNSKIMWSGCGETYPGLLPHHCYSQDQGGYGDGLGTAKTGGNWVFDRADISYNVSDGLDLLYHDGNGTITITHSRFEGNAGNQVKVAAKTIIDNSKLIGNCGYFKGKPFASTTSISFLPVPFNNCRAAGSTLSAAFKPGMNVEIYYSTVTSNGDVMVLSSGANCSPTDKIISKNNIYVGGIEFNNGIDLSDLYYASGQFGNGDGTCGNISMVSSNDIVWGTKYNTLECQGNTSKCVDPKLVGPITLGGDNINVFLQATSPAIKSGTPMVALSNTDYNNFNRGSQWDIGAVEYGSVPSSGGSSTAVCGNGIVDSGESCDGTNLGGKTCVSQGFVNGTLGCTSSCTLNTSSCGLCGNGVINSGESCDGSNLNGKTCSNQGFGSGTLGCTNSCSLNTASCSFCGNGVINSGESCDGSNLNGKTCASQGFAGGTLGCSSSCTLNTAGCSLCGNGVINSTESCDGSNLNGKTCVSQGFKGGTLGCTSSCTFSMSNCNQCGNGVLDYGEECDGTRLDGETCASQGYGGGGTLGCTSSCTFSTVNCKRCGNGVLDYGEECDGTKLNGETCASQGHGGGTLGCTSSCTFSTVNCKRCGNGVLENGEECDGTKLNGETCASQGYGGGGALGCTSSCTFSTANCKRCGNGVLDYGEDCDGTKLNGETCASRGYGGGTLGCTSSCTFSTTNCSRCGNGVIDYGESCDGSNFNGQTCTSKGFTGGTLSCTSFCAIDASRCTTTTFSKGVSVTR